MSTFDELGRANRILVIATSIDASIDHRHRVLHRLTEAVDELITGSEGTSRSGNHELSVPRLENAIEVGEQLLRELRITLSRVKAAEVLGAFR
jgi:hypothetical protein